MSSSNSSPLNRRQFLRYSGLMTAAGLTSVGLNTWTSHQTLAQPPVSRSKRLIVIMLRGAVDGLNILVPYQDPTYYEARPTIALPDPYQDNGVLPLTREFALNPALNAILPLWRNRQLAFVHACGSPDPTRSHFEAQDYLELGTPGSRALQSGWLNRLMSYLPVTRATQAVSIGNTTPLILTGQATSASIPSGRLANQKLSLDRPVVQTAFDRLYQGNTPLSQVYQSGRQAREILMAELKAELMASAKGAPTPSAAFVKDVRRVARLMTGDAQTQIAFLPLGGWDTHIGQGSIRGRLTLLLKPLGQGLAVLAKELGAAFQDTTIVVMSEFGRTVEENGNRGTDHGHGNVMWVLGGRVRGGQVYGNWPGIEPSQRYQGRDLAITTDFRDVLGSVLQQHMGLSSSQLAGVFPNYSFQPQLPLIG